MLTLSYTEKVPSDGYDAKQRRLLRKGNAIDEVPVPACLAANFDFRKLNDGEHVIPCWYGKSAVHNARNQQQVAACTANSFLTLYPYLL